MTKEFLERCLAEGLSLEQIGRRCDRDPSTIRYHMRKHGLEPVNRQRHASRGELPKEALAALVGAGLSVRAIARELDRSPSTVTYWLKRHGLKTRGYAQHREQALAARGRGETTITSRCRHHGETDFYVAPDGESHCKRCRTEAVARWRRKAKRKLVEAAGGSCALCGYDRSTSALHFHHLDPALKSFGIAMKGHTRSMDKLVEEARKCILLCANCHSEVEHGAAEISEDVLRTRGSQGDNLAGRRAA